MNINELIFERKTNTPAEEKITYRTVCNYVREYINDKYREELAGDIQAADAHDRYTILIEKVLQEKSFFLEGYTEKELTEMIYNSMAKFDFLTPFLESSCGNLKDNELFYTWEEINCNRYDDVEVVVAGKYYKLDQTFDDPRACEDMVKKLARIGGLNLDKSNPQGNSFIGNSIRIEAAVAPCVDSDAGAIFSIRRQKSCTNDKGFFVENGTASEDELDLLTTFLDNKVSVGVAGDTGSGKTALMNYLLSHSSDENRKVTIEDTRELSCVKRGKDGKYSSRVVQLVTIDAEDENQAVTADDLLKASLRLNPDIIALGEMRGKEAKTTIQAGGTGHTIITGLHAGGQKSAYRRMTTLYMDASTSLSEKMVYENIVEAIPVIIQMKAFKSGERKIMSISEAILTDDLLHPEIKFNPIYRYSVKGFERDEETDKLVKVVGEHKKVGNISDKLAQRLFENGVELSIIRKYAEPGFIPGKEADDVS